MRKRVFTGWTFRRVLYLFIGCAVVIQSFTTHQWFGVAIGGYFASMGVFAFGCASGNCFGRNCAVPTSTDNPKATANKRL